MRPFDKAIPADGKTERLHLLLVEDDAHYASLVKQYLTPAGTFHLRTTRFLEKGLELLAANTYDAVLLDLNLPDSHGIDTFRHVAAAAPDAAIVILSTLDDEAYIAEALESGAQDYLVKSRVDYQQLAHTLRFAVKRERRALRRFREAVSAVQTRENYYRTLVQNGMEPFFIVSRSGVFKLANQAITPLLGYTPEALHGRLISELIHRDDLAGWVSFEKTVHESPDDVLSTTLRLRHQDGSWRTLQMRWRNLLDDPAVRGILIAVSDATQYRQAVQKRWESESRYQALFERSQDAVYLHDFDGNFLDANPAALEMLGYRDSDIEGLNILDLLSEEERARAIRLLSEIAEHGQQLHLEELHLRRKDGGTVYVETMSAVVLRDGRPWAIQGIARDVTGRFEAQALQREQQLLAEGLRETAEKLLSSTLNLGDVLDHILEQAARLIPCDGATLMLLENGVTRIAGVYGYSDEERRQIEQVELEIAEARNLYELDASNKPLVIDDIREFEGWRRDLLPFLARNRSYMGAPIHTGERLLGIINLDSAEVAHFTEQQAERLTIFCNLAAIALNNARLHERLLSTNEELEERVAQRTTQARQERDRMQAILDQMGDAVVILSRQGEIKHVNPALLDLTGSDQPGDLDGKAFADFLNPEHREMLQDRLQLAAQTMETQRFELKWPNGKERIYDVTVSRLHASDATEAMFVCNLHEITTIKEAEAQLQQALEKEREINELKSHFTSLVSHEFRTPLATISVSADLLRRFWDRLPPEKRQRQLTYIEQQVQRLNNLVSDVASANRAATTGLHYRPVPTHLTRLIRQIVAEENLTQKYDVTVDLTIGDIDDPLTLDPDLFRQICGNLISNAVKYSPPASTVEVDLQRDGEQLRLTVRDQGIGIPGDFQEHIFDSFRRADNVGKRPGTGLGLTILKRAVDAHGGTVEYVSAEGEGTTFTVSLPLGARHGHINARPPSPQTQHLVLNGRQAL